MFLIWCSVLVIAVVLYLYRTYSRFRNYGVKHHKVVPFLGNMWRLIFKVHHISEDVDRLYNDFPEDSVATQEPLTTATSGRATSNSKEMRVAATEHTCAAIPYKMYENYRKYARGGVLWLSRVARVRGPLGNRQINLLMRPECFSRFVGKYEFTKPVVVIRDLELLKRVIVKDFEHFLDHRVSIDSNNDAVFGRNLFSLKGQEWKDMRSTLSPAFTSSKIRMMVPFMEEVGEQMINALKQNINASNNDYIDVDVKELTARYANDVIASCAFGLKVDSHQDVYNQFYAKGKEASDFSFIQMLIFFAYSSFPKLMNYFQISLFSESTKNFFSKLVLNTMRDREERNIIRPDMIHLLMEAKKGKLTHDEKNSLKVDANEGFATVEESSIGKKEINRVWSDKDLIAQAVLFLVAGFETVSTAASFLLHELALHPEVQERLLQEIRQMDEKNGGKFDYNAIQNMKYMDMVLSELLRLWLPVPVLDRICTIDYNMGKPSDKAVEDFILRKGEGVQIPAWSFHHDPQYFPDPLKFDPERFSDENKDKIQPFSYMPFGLGPRNCIGSRFALCEVKVMTYQLLRVFQVTPCPKTQIPAKLSKDTFNPRIEGGNWVRFTIRS